MKLSRKRTFRRWFCSANVSVPIDPPPSPSLIFFFVPSSDMAETLRYLLVGSGEISMENMEVEQNFVSYSLYKNSFIVFSSPPQLTSRSPNEVYEILSLAG